MKIIAITTPRVTDNDAPIINALLDRGIATIHLRKPESTIDECRRVLELLTSAQRSRIIIHYYPELYSEFGLCGIHLNRNITQYPNNYDGHRSRSCHTLEEVAKYRGENDYLFLSPIFDSISKQGYKSAFSHEVLQQASDAGIIDERVIALGGVTLDSLPYLKSLKFGGAAMMGAIYSAEIIEQHSTMEALIEATR